MSDQPPFDPRYPNIWLLPAPLLGVAGGAIAGVAVAAALMFERMRESPLYILGPAAAGALVGYMLGRGIAAMRR